MARYFTIPSRSLQKQIETAVAAARETWKEKQPCPSDADVRGVVHPKAVLSDQTFQKVRSEWEQGKEVEFQRSLQAAKVVLFYHIQYIYFLS